MIVVDMRLFSAISGDVSNLGIITISNYKQYTRGRTQTVADYHVRAYPKKTTVKQIMAGALHHREAIITGPAKNSDPVWSLLLKGLEAMNY